MGGKAGPPAEVPVRAPVPDWRAAPGGRGAVEDPGVLLHRVPATPALAFTGYLIGHVAGFDTFGWAVAAITIIGFPRRTGRRQLAADTRKLAKN